MILLSQRNPAWSQKKLGASSLTIGRFGCTTTAIAMAAELAGHPIAPDTIAANVDAYTKPGNPQGEGLVIWQRIMPEGLQFVSRTVGYNPAMIDKAMGDPQLFVLLEVANGSHWVLALRKEGSEYIAADPLLGDECCVLRRYSNITKYVVIRATDELKDTNVAVDREFGKKQAGKVLLSVEERGRLYWVDLDGVKHNLGATPSEVVMALSKLAVGISLADLNKIP